MRAQQVDVGSRSIVETVESLRPGQYIWAPQVAPGGPMLLVVNLKTQRSVLFRNGVPIGASTVSTGRPGYETPTGVFTILQKHVEHYSSKYDNAPMPYMERLTWYGVALHAGHLPGFPASHGCIRMPAGFAKLLYGVTKLGMTVIITANPATPRVAPRPDIVALAEPLPPGTVGTFDWHPERSPKGPVSIVVSVADRRAIVIRNGMIIGSGPVTVDGPVDGTWAYMLRSTDALGRHWQRIALSSSEAADQPVAKEEWQRFHAPEPFRRAVAAILESGATVVVTSDSLGSGSTAKPVAVIEGPDR